MEDLPNEAFYFRLSGRHLGLLSALRSLVPSQHRNLNHGWGYDPELYAWRIPLRYLSDFLLIVDQLAKAWEVKLVDVLEATEVMQTEEDSCS